MRFPGFAFSALAALTLCTAPAQATLTQPGPPPTRSFAGSADLLVDRDESFGAILATIEGAKHSIAIDYYVLGGARALTVADRLIQRHREGIAIRILLDPDMGSLPVIQALTAPVLAKLREARLPVRFYPRDALGRLHNYRLVEDHTKVVSADGDTAFVGSMNFGGELLHNHDVGIKVSGQVAHAIAADVLRAFALATPMGPEELRPWPAAELPKRLGASEIGYVPTGLSGAGAREVVVSAIAHAHSSVRVMMFQLEDEAATDALLAARARGVDVRVLVDPNDLDLLSPIGWCPRGIFNLAMVSRLAAGGVPVRWFAAGPNARQLHAKAAVIDGTQLLAGSTNWNHFGFDLNNETMLAVSGGQAPGRFAALFDTDWTQRTTPVDSPSAALGPTLWLYQGLAFALN